MKLFKLLRDIGIVAGVAVIVVEAMGIASYLLWSKGFNIAFIVFGCVVLVGLALGASFSAIPNVLLGNACANITRTCYICPEDTAEVCIIGAIEEGKECWTAKTSFELICEKTITNLMTILALIFLLVLLTLVGAIIGCCGVAYIRTYDEYSYSPVLQGGKYNVNFL